MSSEPTTVGWEEPAHAAELPLIAAPSSVFEPLQTVVGRKWHLRIVYWLLEDGPMGFSTLKARIDGISSKMLSESLDSLSTQGLVDRSLLSDQPVRVEYELTEAGRALEPAVAALTRWYAEYGSER